MIDIAAQMRNEFGIASIQRAFEPEQKKLSGLVIGTIKDRGDPVVHQFRAQTRELAKTTIAGSLATMVEPFNEKRNGSFPHRIHSLGELVFLNRSLPDQISQSLFRGNLLAFPFAHQTLISLTPRPIRQFQAPSPWADGYNPRDMPTTCRALLTAVAAFVFISHCVAGVKPATVSIQLKPGSASERAHLAGIKNSRIEGVYRLIGRSGLVEYRFRCLGGAKSSFAVDAFGNATVHIDDTGRSLKWVKLRGQRRRFQIPFVTDLRGIVHQMRVRISTTAAQRFQIYSLTFSAADQDVDQDGIGDGFERLLSESATHLHARRAPSHVFAETSSGYRPEIDLGADHIVLRAATDATIASWKNHGSQVVAIGDMFAAPGAVPQPLQTDVNGDSVRLQGNPLLVPTSAAATAASDMLNLLATSKIHETALDLPGFAVRAGYSTAFREAWRTRYGSDWEPLHGSISARRRAETLKAHMLRDYAQTVLAPDRSHERAIALPNPVAAFLNELNLPYSELLRLTDRPQVLGRLSMAVTGHPVSYRGFRDAEPFSLAYLQATSIAGWSRFTRKQVGAALDLLSLDARLSPDDARRWMRQQVVASFMFPQISSFSLVTDLEQFVGKMTSPYGVEVYAVARTAEQIAAEPVRKFDAGSAGFAILYSDSLTWQLQPPSPASPDDLLGLCLPLVKRGVPIELLNIDQVRSTADLRDIRAIALSYDALKPKSVESQRALADWVRAGGQLLIVGGTDPYSSAADAWWRVAGHSSPTAALFRELGLNVSIHGETPDRTPDSTWMPVGRFAPDQPTARRQIAIELTEFVRTDGTIYVRFQDDRPEHGSGAKLSRFALEVDGRVVAAFLPGSPIEDVFIYMNAGSQAKDGVRSADGTGQWIYRFTVSPGRNTRVVAEVSHEFRIDVSHQPPYPERILSPIHKELPPVTLHGNETLTSADIMNSATPLYSLAPRRSAIPAFTAEVGKGGVVFLGISPRYLVRSEEGDTLYRAIAAFTYQRSGERFRERARFVMRRGKYVVAYGTYRTTRVLGSYVNLFDENLSIEQNPALYAGQAALWLDVDPITDANRFSMLFCTARILQSSESDDRAAYLVTGPSGGRGAMRLWVGRHSVEVEGIAPDGSPVPVQTQLDRRSMLIIFPTSANGTVIRLRW